MRLTQALLKKGKTKNVLVEAVSRVSGHKRLIIRARTADKVQEIMLDPIVDMEVPYDEKRKIHGIGKKE